MKLVNINLYREEKLRKQTGNPNAVLPLNRDHKRFVASASLASVLVLVTLANGSLLSRTGERRLFAGRGIASVESEVAPEVSSGWLTAYVQSQKENIPSRGLASLGSAPSAIDNLRFGLLEGKYAIRTYSGQVREVEFIESSASDRPKYIENKEAFLKTMMDLHKINFSRLSLASVNQESSSQGQVEVYKMVSQDGVTVGQAQFTLDEFGRLRALSLESSK